MRFILLFQVVLIFQTAVGQEKQVLKSIENWQQENNTVLPQSLKRKIVEDQKNTKKRLLEANFKEEKINEVTDAAMNKYLFYLKENNDKRKYPVVDEFMENELGAKNKKQTFLNIYGEVTIASEPKDAQVFIENEFVGYANVTYMVMRGNVFITLKSDGYIPLTKTILVEPRRNYSFTWTLIKTP